MRLADDPSGEAFQRDLLQALAAAEQKTGDQIDGGAPAVGIERELRYALALGSINSLSNNLPGDLLAALVGCGHWQATVALRAVRMNPDGRERERALAALAPLLDEPLISDALHQARALGSYWNSGLVQVLRRLCELDQGERALAEVMQLPVDARTPMLDQLADRLAEPQLGAAISLVSSRIVASKEITTSEAGESALARLFSHAPASLLVPPAEIPGREGEVRSRILQAVAIRWAALGRIDLCTDYLEAMTASGRARTLAKLLPFVADADRQTRQQYMNEALGAWPTLHPVHQAELAADLARFLTPGEVSALAEQVFTEEQLARALDVARVFRILAPVLPFDAVENAARRAKDLEEYDSQKALVSLAFRAADLGRPEDAVRLARMGVDSYRVGESLLEVLPRIAALGHHDLAVSYAERADVFGRDHFVPATLIGVSRHVSGPLLDRLRDRARLIAGSDDRRRALLGIASRYAQVGQPEEALALARLIGDAGERWPVHASIVASRAQATGDCERAVEQAAQLPAFWKWKTLGDLAGDLQTPMLGPLVQDIVRSTAGGASADTFARREALVALLQRYAQLGFVEEAWALAQQEPPEGRYFLVAGVAPYVDEPARTRRLEEAIRQVRAIPDYPYWRKSALAKIVDQLSERSLREFESELTANPHDVEVIKEIIKRYANLGLVAEALRVTGQTRSSGDIWPFVAPHLDADGVRVAFSMSDHFWPYAAAAERTLAARLVDLGMRDAALERIQALPEAEVRFAALAGAASRAPIELLERLSAMVFRRGGSAEERLAESDEAVVAIGRRLGVLGQCDRAVAMLRLVSRTGSSTAIGETLVDIASGLEDAPLEEAIENLVEPGVGELAGGRSPGTCRRPSPARPPQRRGRATGHDGRRGRHRAARPTRGAGGPRARAHCLAQFGSALYLDGRRAGDLGANPPARVQRSVGADAPGRPDRRIGGARCLVRCRRRDRAALAVMASRPSAGDLRRARWSHVTLERAVPIRPSNRRRRHIRSAYRTRRD